MRGIKIPQQNFALKMPGGLMREGRRIFGTLRYIKSMVVISAVCSNNALMYVLPAARNLHYTKANIIVMPREHEQLNFITAASNVSFNNTLYI